MHTLFKNKWFYFIIILALLALVKLCNTNYIFKDKTSTSTEIKKNNKEDFVKKNNTKKERSIQKKNINIPVGKVPQKVIEVWHYVKENNEAMPGYVGGREFKNREKNLPVENNKGIKIKYFEWDVNPKIKGKNRGTERLVTDNEGKAYYTNNHYKTFILIE